MWNLLISLALGLAVALAVRFGTEFGWAAAVFPGLIVALAAYLVLARRTWKRLEAIFEGMQREVQAQKFDKAILTLESGFALAPWQFLVAAQLHSNIGILQYIRKNFDAALPHLEKSFSRNWIARGMLAVTRYKRRDLAGAKKVFEDAVKVNKKEGVLWATYAWVLENEGEHEAAIAVLGRAVKANESDEKLKASLQALQNGKKLKLGKTYAEQWFQFHLEAPPPQFVGGPGFRGNRRAIYRG
ncbi:tetratricopeptide repeat protein [Anaeromyxobacter oryzisoli]|jgi:tetratricopeptide (TPR) repeat protein|uniref:tetratricopeptide repeat protein n=1 Tax=Anaeromyxobacter oryzisoli TaxID=2925408 RepID=UPI001F587C4F|nr:tetratricopeptide repeat protein [Anaeromyxobacter sp. SG63]